MKDIIDLTVAQIRVFAVDAIPFRVLRNQEVLGEFRQRLGFVQAMLDPTSPAIAFHGGRFESEGGKHVIDALAIEPRRIQLQVLGPSKVADECFAAIQHVIDGAAGGNVFTAKPIVTSQETTCTVSLDFHVERLFAPEVLAFAREDLLPRSGLIGSKAFVQSLKLDVTVGYAMQDGGMAAQSVSLSPKQFVIEPRAGTRLEERRYFTSSPLDSDSHLKVLELLEKRLASGKSR